MKVLLVNKFHYIKGGSETYYFELKRLLESKGHTVIDFSMKDERNLDSPYSDYFVNHIDYEESKGVGAKLRMALNIIYSREAKKKFEALILKEKPDLIHLHIFQHQMSPSILDVAKKYNIPTVYTAHDLKMICLNYKMMHHGKVCEDCKDGHYYHCAQNCCVKGSFSKSCINVVEGYLHKWRKSYDAIDIIITPSAFYKKKFEEFGVATDRIVHIPNFLDRDKPNVNFVENSKNYYLYFGRLSEEKGVLTTIKAFEEIKAKLYVVGTGPLKEDLINYVNSNKLNNIVFLGFKSGQDLIDLIGNAKAVILSSEWYENGPYSAIEALQLGRPVIGANIGGIPELINKNGYLYISGDVSDLDRVLHLFEGIDSLTYANFEKESFYLFNQKYTVEKHYEMLKSAYRKAMVKL